MVPRDGFITLAGCGIQKKRCPLSAPLLVGSRPTDGFQFAQFLLAEVEGTALPRKGHAPLKHKLVKLYRYLENDHLALSVHLSAALLTVVLAKSDLIDKLEVVLFPSIP